jgi:hypothetical protein
MALKPIQTKKRYWQYIPLAGIPTFVLLYIIATLYYPGGSQTNAHAIGFSWLHNYWCNLLNNQAVNGQANAAKPIAVSAMVLLCISLTVFWYFFPYSTTVKKGLQQMVRYSGTLAMITASLLGILEHDWVINMASLMGFFAVTGTIFILKRLSWTTLFWFGVVNTLLVGINNLFYYNESLIRYLPIIQKITFAAFLIWIWLITYYTRPKVNN